MDKVCEHDKKQIEKLKMMTSKDDLYDELSEEEKKRLEEEYRDLLIRLYSWESFI